MATWSKCLAGGRADETRGPARSDERRQKQSEVPASHNRASGPAEHSREGGGCRASERKREQTPPAERAGSPGPVPRPPPQDGSSPKEALAKQTERRQNDRSS